MTRTEKEQFISDLRERFQKAEAMLAVAFSGLSVSDATDLRKRFRDNGVEYRVVKNTLAKLASEGTDVEPLRDQFIGPTAVVLGYTDVVAPAKILHGFIKEKAGKLEVKGGVVSGKLVSPKEVEDLSRLPSLPELRAMLLGMLNTPAQTLLRLMNTPATQMAQVLKAKAEKTE